MHNKTASNMCVYISQEITINNKTILQENWFTDLFAVNKSNGKYLIYLPKQNNHFSIDTTGKILKPIDYENHFKQIIQLKSLIGHIYSERKNHQIHFYNTPNNDIKLNGNILLGQFQYLKNTVYMEFVEFMSQLQIYDIDVDNYEFIKESKTTLLYNGTEQNTILKTNSIKTLPNFDNLNEFLNYKIL